ncbi:MAG: hypothetical protein IMW85_09635, partial [Thermicanus sp.]|nr:hypothetical protein [Thermicanus sp.]
MGKQGKKTNMRKKGYKSEPSKKGKVSCLFIYICKNKGVNKRKHNPIQKVIVKKVLQPVRVIGYKFDIRSLQAKRDKIQIFGFDGKQIKPVLTDSKGRVKVVQ